MLLFFTAAFAQDVATAGASPAINVQTFRPSIDSHDFFRLVDSELPAKGLTGRGMFSHTASPLQYTSGDGETVDIVSDIVQLNASVAYTTGKLRLGLDLPIVLRSFGGEDADATGLGELLVEGKYRLLDGKSSAFGLALSARSVVPTSTVAGALSSQGPGIGFGFGVDKRLASLHIAASGGLDYVPPAELENVSWGSQAHVQLGLSYAFSKKVGLVSEIYASGVLDDFENPMARPSEVLFGGWYRTAKRGALGIRPAVAFGIGDAISTPTSRLILSVAWDPMAPPDRDKDGLADDADTCPDVPEDVDSFADADGCPELASVTLHVVDTDGVTSDEFWTLEANGKTGPSGAVVELAAGKIEVSAAGVTVVGEVPPGGPAAVTVTLPAPRGKLVISLLDAKKQAVMGASWKATGPTDVPKSPAGTVSVRPGSYIVVGRAEGYRPAHAIVELKRDGSAVLVLEMVPARAALRAERIEIKDSVYFETGKALIKAQSFSLLDEVAEVLRDHPELKKIRIEGHTDSRGKDKDNLILSQARAESVRTFLASKGVEIARLESIGYGESKPLVKEKSEADRAKNRRVDFFVVEQAP